MREGVQEGGSIVYEYRRERVREGVQAVRGRGSAPSVRSGAGIVLGGIRGYTASRLVLDFSNPPRPSVSCVPSPFTPRGPLGASIVPV